MKWYLGGRGIWREDNVFYFGYQEFEMFSDRFKWKCLVVQESILGRRSNEKLLEYIVIFVFMGWMKLFKECEKVEQGVEDIILGNINS